MKTPFKKTLIIGGGVAGPLLRRFQDLLFPLALKYFVHSDSENWLYQYRIDWDEPVRERVVAR